MRVALFLASLVVGLLSALLIVVAVVSWVAPPARGSTRDDDCQPIGQVRADSAGATWRELNPDELAVAQAAWFLDGDGDSLPRGDAAFLVTSPAPAPGATVMFSDGRRVCDTLPLAANRIQFLDVLRRAAEVRHGAWAL